MINTRKTISVATIKEEVNAYLKDTADAMKSEREGQIRLLESILLQSGNYHGFGYLGKAEMEDSCDGISVGIVWNEDGSKPDFTDTDNTRVVYQ